MNDSRIKHLEMIQNIISRMASNSFMLKGWAVTLVSGIFFLSAKDSNTLLYLVAFIPILLFWFLDSYYLQMERKYRSLYSEVIEKVDETDFNLAVAKSNKHKKTKFFQSLLSVTEMWFYFPIAILVAIIMTITEMLK